MVDREYRVNNRGMNEMGVRKMRFIEVYKFHMRRSGESGMLDGKSK